MTRNLNIIGAGGMISAFVIKFIDPPKETKDFLALTAIVIVSFVFFAAASICSHIDKHLKK